MRLSFIAKRNLRRHLSNTIRNIVAVSISAIILVLLFGIMGGLEKELKTAITEVLSGEIRIQNKEYGENEIFNPAYSLVHNVEEIVSILEQHKAVEAISLKLYVPVAIYIQDDKYEPIELLGIDFEREQVYNDFLDYVIEGRLPKAGAKELLLSVSTAKLFDLKVGDTITFIGSTALRGSNGMSAVVTGIFDYSIDLLNTRKAIVSLDMAQDFFRSPNASTEVAFRTTSAYKKSLQSLATEFGKALKGKSYIIKHRSGNTNEAKKIEDELDVQVWNEISSFVQMITMGRVIYFFIGLVFCLLGSLVVYNTIYLAMLNRRYEFGVMNAMGFSNAMLRRILKFEVLFTVIIGSLLGTMLGVFFVALMGHYGIDFQKLGSDMGDSTLFSNISRPHISLLWITIVLVYNFVVSFIVGIFPLHLLKKHTVLSLLKSD